MASAELSEVDDHQVELMLDRPLSILENWQKQLPSDLDFDFTNGIPESLMAMPHCRSLASLYLRFHQVIPPHNASLLLDF